MPIVYQATNRFNGHRYIGVSKKSLNSRRTQHFCHARRTPEKAPFLSAIAKYGEDAFVWEVLETFDTYDAAIATEVRLIAECKPEYNVTKGGLGTRGVKRSASWIAQWMERRHRGPEASSRQVICLDDGRIYPSASAAAVAYAVSKSALIELCQGNRRRLSVGGRKFRYVDRTPAEIESARQRETAQTREKLTKQAVSEIKQLLPFKKDSAIAALYGVHRITIYDIRTGRSWKDHK